MPETGACVFCRIVSGELPSHKIYEDGDFLAFHDIRPLNPGHTLVIPKAHYRWTYDVPNYGDYFEAVKKIGLAAISALGADSFSVVTLGHEVRHAHVWIVPRFPDDGHPGVLDWNSVKDIPQDEMELIAEKIRSHIEGA